MKCPQCPDVTLVMAERHGVEIDYCPSCRGVWLDRGELDKLLDRAGATSVPGGAYAPQAAPTHRPHRPDFDDSDFHGSRSYPRSRKKSWLSEIFD